MGQCVSQSNAPSMLCSQQHPFTWQTLYILRSWDATNRCVRRFHSAMPGGEGLLCMAYLPERCRRRSSACSPARTGATGRTSRAVLLPEHLANRSAWEWLAAAAARCCCSAVHGGLVNAWGCLPAAHAWGCAAGACWRITAPSGTSSCSISSCAIKWMRDQTEFVVRKMQ